MDDNNQSEDECQHYPETQNLMEEGKKDDTVAEEKLCRVGWQVKHICTTGLLAYMID